MIAHIKTNKRCKVLLQSVPANIKARMCFQHYGALAHFSADVRSALDTAYPLRWIRREGPEVVVAVWSTTSRSEITLLRGKGVSQISPPEYNFVCAT
ncbi:UNVERIFIED_CONTAM: hypothetical protein NCL1_60454 [Trichonephila clavipes]